VPVVIFTRKAVEDGHPRDTAAAKLLKIPRRTILLYTDVRLYRFANNIILSLSVAVTSKFGPRYIIQRVVGNVFQSFLADGRGIFRTSISTTIKDITIL